MGHNLFYCFLRGKIALCWDTNVLISQLPGQTSPAHIPFNLLRNGFVIQLRPWMCRWWWWLWKYVEWGRINILHSPSPRFASETETWKKLLSHEIQNGKKIHPKIQRFWDLIKCSKEDWSNWWLWLFHFLDACVNYHPTSRKNPFHTR